MEERIITGSMLNHLNHYLLLRNFSFLCDFGSDYQRVHLQLIYEMHGCTVTVSANERAKKVISDFFKDEGISIKFIENDSVFVNAGISDYADICIPDISQDMKNNEFGQLDEEDITD